MTFAPPPDGPAPSCRAEAVPAGFSMARYCVTDPARRHPQQPALTVIHDRNGRASHYSYAQVAQAVMSSANALRAAGMQPGDRVLLRMGNRAEFPFAFFGAIAGGGIAVPVSAQLTAPEVEWIARDADPRVAVVDADWTLRLPSGGRVLDPGDLLSHGHSDAGAGAPAGQSHKVALEPTQDELRDPIPTAPDDPAFLTYTSGTTGRAKGVLHAQRSAWGRRPMYRHWYGLGPTDVLLHAGALNWTYTLGTGLTDPWAVGATAVVYDGPPDRLIWPHLIEQAQATIFAAVPGVFRHLLHHGEPESWNLGSLRHALVAGEALPASLWHDWRQATGKPLYEALGMSEISTFISSGPTIASRPGSPGRAQPGRRIAVVRAPAQGLDSDSELKVQPAGSPGLLAVHRSDPGLMLGYWRRPAQSAEAFRGEWFVSSDVVDVGQDGYLTYHGRADDVMTSLGYRVSPAEVEQCLSLVPGVAQVAVAEVDRGDGVRPITAFVVPTAEACAASLPATLRTHAAAHLAAYKCPRQINLVASLPRTPNGKIIRSRLRGTGATATITEPSAAPIAEAD